MHFQPNGIYHLYNRGNNKQLIFFSNENYLFFLKKINAQLKPICDILCWCLMPNHFHLIISANDNSCIERSTFRSKTGSLFQQKTKSKDLSETKDYLIECMHYIHQNAWRAGLVNKIEEWPYSSFLDYAGLRHGILCNKSLLMELTGYDLNNFYEDSYNVIEDADRKFFQGL